MNKIQLYRVILKVMALLGIIALLWVFLNASSTPDDSQANSVSYSNTVDLADLAAGELKLAQFGALSVAILHRSEADQAKLAMAAQQSPKEATEQAVSKHPWRSMMLPYLVVVNRGDSGNCPLFSGNGMLKDTCTGSLFDSTGRRRLSGGQNALSVPPHYFSGPDTVVVGRWLP